MHMDSISEIHKKSNKFTDDWTEGWTHGQTDAEGYNIIQPFFKRAYKVYHLSSIRLKINH